jgi:hypothetical protein
MPRRLRVVLLRRRRGLLFKAIRIFVWNLGMLVASADVADGTFFAIAKVLPLE